jgi:hypothetical protein
LAAVASVAAPLALPDVLVDAAPPASVVPVEVEAPALVDPKPEAPFVRAPLVDEG